VPKKPVHDPTFVPAWAEEYHLLGPADKAAFLITELRTGTTDNAQYIYEQIMNLGRIVEQTGGYFSLMEEIRADRALSGRIASWVAETYPRLHKEAMMTPRENPDSAIQLVLAVLVNLLGGNDNKPTLTRRVGLWLMGVR